MGKKKAETGEDNKERTRAPNFDSRDQETLVDIVLTKYKSIVENMKTDAVTSRQKTAAWKSIADDFNAIASVKRSAENLKTLYFNLKSRAKKAAAMDKVEVYKTGGGKKPKGLELVGEKLLAALGPKVNPLSNPYDSDAVYNGEEFGMILD
jgi:hypothetical protein